MSKKIEKKVWPEYFEAILRRSLQIARQNYFVSFKPIIIPIIAPPLLKISEETENKPAPHIFGI